MRGSPFSSRALAKFTDVAASLSGMTSNHFESQCSIFILRYSMQLSSRDSMSSLLPAITR